MSTYTQEQEVRALIRKELADVLPGMIESIIKNKLDTIGKEADRKEG